ncbi:uncharacterized protein TNCV_588811 [Trichonephila clavipes]|nr:uncharacterized protein TNCV_588811 [Trichonephila clavipes]
MQTLMPSPVFEPMPYATVVSVTNHPTGWATKNYGMWPVGSLVVRASDSRPNGLGSIPVPPNTLQVHTEYVLVKSVGPKVLWVESRVQRTGENFPPLHFHA